VAELTAKYGADKIDAQLIAGGGGVFDVVIDGEKAFSKHDTGRFPEYAEIGQFIDQKLINS